MHETKRAIVQTLLTLKVEAPAEAMGGQTEESGENSLRRILMGTFLHEISKRIVRIVPGLSGLLGKETLKISYKKTKEKTGYSPPITGANVPAKTIRESKTGYSPPITGANVPARKIRESKTGYSPPITGANVPARKNRESKPGYSPPITGAKIPARKNRESITSTQQNARNTCVSNSIELCEQFNSLLSGKDHICEQQQLNAATKPTSTQPNARNTCVNNSSNSCKEHICEQFKQLKAATKPTSTQQNARNTCVSNSIQLCEQFNSLLSCKEHICEQF